MKKVVLAYSGGLDTSIIIPWLKENYGCEVICMAADLGQGEELAPLNEKAIKSGASKIYIEDLKDEFVKDFAFPVLKSGCLYEGKYLLGTSFARPLIAKRLVEIAEAEGAQYVAHGATGKGNDQVRFELTVKALNPDLKIIAPWREWDIKSREDAVDYAEARGIPVPVTKSRPYSMDRNIFHLSHEGADLEDPWNEPLKDLCMICNNPENAPDKPEYVEIEFEKGVPIAINGEKLGSLALLEKANEIAAVHGVGIIDMVENRLVGMKSRGVYETPGGTLLHKAHKELEALTLDRATTEYKNIVGIKYAQLVYDGLWYTPLKEALDAFIDSTQEAKSPYSLYNQEFVTFGEDQVYNQKDAEGFINLFGLPLTVRALMKKQLANK